MAVMGFSQPLIFDLKICIQGFSTMLIPNIDMAFSENSLFPRYEEVYLVKSITNVLEMNFCSNSIKIRFACMIEIRFQVFNIRESTGSIIFQKYCTTKLVDIENY